MTLLLDFQAPNALLTSIAAALSCGQQHPPVDYQWRHFPDGESYFRVVDDVAGHAVCIVAGLNNPDGKVLPLLLLSETLRDLGASRVDLVVPYLPYMRQDARFVDGEGITARYFPKLIERSFDRLITVDPHLHRIHDLSEVYSIPTAVLSASQPIAEWIERHVEKPLLVGPDQESEQWLAAIATIVGAPVAVMHKTRSGDRLVEVQCQGELSEFQHYQPILIDDMISTGKTIIAAAERLTRLGLTKPLCICVHGLFGDGDKELQQACSKVLSCNSVSPVVEGIEQIDLGRLIADAI